jgi:hypothetical protein
MNRSQQQSLFDVGEDLGPVLGTGSASDINILPDRPGPAPDLRPRSQATPLAKPIATRSCPVCDGPAMREGRTDVWQCLKCGIAFKPMKGQG